MRTVKGPDPTGTIQNGFSFIWGTDPVPRSSLGCHGAVSLAGVPWPSLAREPQGGLPLPAMRLPEEACP